MKYRFRILFHLFLHQLLDFTKIISLKVCRAHCSKELAQRQDCCCRNGLIGDYWGQIRKRSAIVSQPYRGTYTSCALYERYPLWCLQRKSINKILYLWFSHVEDYHILLVRVWFLKFHTNISFIIFCYIKKNEILNHMCNSNMFVTNKPLTIRPMNLFSCAVKFLMLKFLLKPAFH